MYTKQPLVILVGPTAIGKTAISIQIAKKIDGEIISADSMQIYKYMDIGTAKVNEEEMNSIKHYMIDEILPNEEFSASDFQQKAKYYIKTIANKGKIPMLVGGTGLYINSIVYNLDFTNAVSDWELRAKYNRIAEKFGNGYLHEELKKVDLESYNRIHINDRKRIIRALEIYHITGKPMSYYYKKFREENKEYRLIFLGLNMNRKRLYERINKRVDTMIEKGIIDEVKNLLSKGYSPSSIALQGLGYKEIIKYLEGEWSLEEAIHILKRDTRRFAKRQITWFRRDKRIRWFNKDNYENDTYLTEDIVKYIRKDLNHS
ncbi:tRNA (adenosine(37)-N6)-dimethylallyltransferase MiaA [Clostridiisalibacter paucivorans]|uniref:tRNA (adenosine(37)-N6)-dimethylallyltransferase MiaA n=1 Tax=Clostridiisalibacter paucivorans TaxID=408753 RepID=UPI00047C2206|nr:tRNA (adenosine(37)-N6)-dimethylallyltransferase MiaA [Clostridiisalibacter paucivorans]